MERWLKKNIPFSILLQKGQTYLVQGIYDSTDQDFTGTTIHSIKPIALLSGHACTSIPSPPEDSHDILLQQIPPISQLDTFDVCVPFGARTQGDYFRVITGDDSVIIIIDNKYRGIVKPHSFFEIDTTSVFTVHISIPSLVMQYMKTSNDSSGLWDPSLLLDVPPSKWLNSYTYVHPIDTTWHLQFATVIIADSAKQTFLADGMSINDTSFHPIANTPYDYAYILQTQGLHTLTAVVPFGAYFYGGGYHNSYAAPCGGAYQLPRDCTWMPSSIRSIRRAWGAARIRL